MAAVPPAAAWPPFSRVRLRGLARAELNGVVVVVLPPDDEKEAKQLAEAGRVKVSHYPKPLALQAERLEPAPEPDFATPPLPFTALQIVRADPAIAELCAVAAAAGEQLGGLGEVGALYDAEDFAEALWQVYGPVMPARPLPADFQTVILDTPGHWLYWLGLEQVGHHIIIEACDGVWRGYQAVARPPGPEAEKAQEGREFESFAGVLLQKASTGPRGYSAAMWAQPLSPTPEGAQAADEEEQEDAIGGPFAEPSAHALWGGGRDLGREAAAEVLALLATLQRQTQLVADALRKQVGAGAAGDDAECVEWAQARSEVPISVTPERPISPRSTPGYAQADDVWIFSQQGAEPSCDLSLASQLAYPFMKTFAALTGQYPTGRTYMRVIEHAGWKSLEREDGGSVGWTFRALDLRAPRGGAG